jgi:hypothetical protein
MEKIRNKLVVLLVKPRWNEELTSDVGITQGVITSFYCGILS